MKTKAKQVFYDKQLIATYEEYNILVTEWIDTVIACALLTTKGIRYSGEKMQKFFDSQVNYLSDVIDQYRADNSQKYDARRKRITQADEDDLEYESRDFADQKLREWLADLGFSDPTMARLSAPMQSGWKRFADGQKELLRIDWWQSNGGLLVKLYVASSLLNLRELSEEKGMLRIGIKRIEWLYGKIVDGMQEFYSLFFKASEDSSNRILEKIEARHKIMKEAGIKFTLVPIEGIDSVFKGKTSSAPAKPDEAPLPEQYSRIFDEARRGMGERTVKL